MCESTAGGCSEGLDAFRFQSYDQVQVFPSSYVKVQYKTLDCSEENERFEQQRKHGVFHLLRRL